MIQIKNMSFCFKKDKQVFKDIYADLPAGALYGLFGSNGIGKTTFLKLIAGLLFPNQGEIFVNEMQPKLRSRTFLSDIYFVTDENELPKWSIHQICRVYGSMYPKFSKEHFYEYLKMVSVDEQENIGNLSFGQQKKVNIAFALATGVRVLLMDEPTNGLDTHSKSQFRKALSQFISDDSWVFISTHQVRDLQQIIDHVLLFEDQKIALNMSLYDINARLKVTQQVLESDHILYSENNINGNWYLCENTDESYSNIDLEFLINAFHQHPEISIHFHLKDLQNENQ